MPSWYANDQAITTATVLARGSTITLFIDELGTEGDQVNVTFYDHAGSIFGIANGLIAVAQEKNPLVRFRREQAVGSGERLSNCGRARIGGDRRHV